MKRNSLIVLIILIFSILNSEMVPASIILPGENDTVSLYGELSSEILKNPSGDLVPFYIEKLMELAPAAGDKKTADLFKEVSVKLKDREPERAFIKQLLSLSIDELDDNYNESIKNFSILKKWNISGPWKRYGKPDIDCEFAPEKMFKIENIEKGQNFSTEENGLLYPFKYKHGADEIYYASCSFQAEGGVILWIVSDGKYKLSVNGREISHNRSGGEKTVKAFSLKGSKGYSLQIKLQCGDENSHPFIRGMITDEAHLPVKVSGSSSVFNYKFTSEKIFSLDEKGYSVPSDASDLTQRMSEFIQAGDYLTAYKQGVSITEKFPSYFPAYKEFIPLLDVMSRDDEFHQYTRKFNEIFPDSRISRIWLADFYMTRDKEKFSAIMKSVNIKHMKVKTLESYIYLLCGEKKYTEALTLCSSSRGSEPQFKFLKTEIIKASGDSTLLRKYLIEGAAERDEADFYYQLGLAEMNHGLDPVMYWRKGYSLDDDSGMMRDLSDLYENSILGSNDFYTGVYTDLHPEFSWNGKKRKISIHIFESGRVVLEGEDILPPGSKLRKKKYSYGETEFSSGEIKTSVPYADGVKILYVLTAKDGLPTPSGFTSVADGKNRLTVKYRCSGGEEFSVIRYSGEYTSPAKGIITILKELILKAPDENVSQLEYEVIYHGNSALHVRYKGEALSAGKYTDGVIKYTVNDRFDEDDKDHAVSDILKFSSDSKFAEWYNTVLTYAEKYADEISIKFTENDNTESIIKKIHFYVMSSVSDRGDISLGPEEINSVLSRGEGTVEERALLAKVILEKNGIKSFISFRKNRDGLIDRILLYVPEKRDSGYWLDFYGDGILEKMESGYEALVLTGESFETFPVNPETCIR
jgi:hypothetical protein